MSRENEDLLRRYYDAWNRGDLAALDELVAPDLVNHDPALPGLPPGREGVKAVLAGFRSAFPYLHYTIEDQVSGGDKVVTRFTLRGTNRGEFGGMPATGKSVTVAGITIERIADGKTVEYWRRTDDLGIMQQLGVFPGLSQAA